MRRHPLLLALVPALALAACGGSSKTTSSLSTRGSAANSAVAAATSSAAAAAATSSTAAAKGPCSLATTDQIAAAFGGTVSSGGADPADPGGKRCTWQVSGASNLGQDGTVSIFYFAVQSRSAFDTAKSGLSSVTTSVAGVGDDAFYMTSTGALQFVKGDTVLTVQGVFGSGSRRADVTAVQADVTALAKTVAAAL